MDCLQMLNAPTAKERLENLETLLQNETRKPDVSDVFVNNHIHTTYSFSPYSPTAAIWFARAQTLPTAGIMDHDSMAGAWEFIRAGIDTVQEVFAPLRARRNERNRKMTDNISALLSPHGISLDFDADVLPLSQASDGGSVTERHLIFALCRKIIETCGREGTAAFVGQTLGVSLSDKQKSLLEQMRNAG